MKTTVIKFYCDVCGCEVHDPQTWCSSDILKNSNRIIDVYFSCKNTSYPVSDFFLCPKCKIKVLKGVIKKLETLKET